MVPVLEKLYLELEHQREVFLTEIRKHGEPAVYRTTDGHWNMVQVIGHLCISEKTSLDYLEKKMRGLEQATPSTLWELFKVGGLILSQRLPLRYTAPRGASLPEPTTCPLEEAIALWMAERQRLHTLLNRFAAQDVNKKVYRHIVIGLVDVRHMLIFFREHVYHHRWQIKRLQRQRK